MSTVHPDFFPRRINMRVPSMSYAADVAMEGPYKLRFGALAAKSATYFASAVAMVNGSAVAITVAAGTILNSGIEPARYGRGLALVASSTNTRVATVTGYDYLGQKMVEAITMNSGTPVNSLKAFKYLESISWASAADTTTVNVGQSDVLGLSYRGSILIGAILNDGAATGAGTFVAGLAAATTPTATTADNRGTWTPNGSDIPNGTRELSIIYEPDRGNLHGAAQYAG